MVYSAGEKAILEIPGSAIPAKIEIVEPEALTYKTFNETGSLKLVIIVPTAIADFPLPMAVAKLASEDMVVELVVSTSTTKE